MTTRTISMDCARGIARRLGIPDETPVTAELLVAVLDEVETENDARTVDAGEVVISLVELEALRADAAEGKNALLAQYADRYHASNREAWSAQYDLDPEGTLAELEAATPIPPALRELAENGATP